MMPRRVLIFAVCVVLITGPSFLYFTYFAKGPCDAPIAYKIGTVDSRFGVTADAFKTDVAQAADIWNQSILQKNLLTYDPNGVVTINLVYDNRQALTQREQTLNANINQTSQTADSIKQEYSALKAQYTEAQQVYATQLASFTEAQTSYNAEVDHWNSVGGAPKPQYDVLSAEKNSLATKQAALEQQRQNVNQLADAVNAYINKYNLLISYINSDVSAINNDGLAGTQFEEGVYISDASGKKINIYQFENHVDLIRVLAHELGHSLGLGHNPNPNSIMNPVNQSTSLTLSVDDLQALKTECGIK